MTNLSRLRVSFSCCLICLALGAVASPKANADVVLGGQTYAPAGAPVTVSHGFRDNLYSSPLLSSARYLRITATSLTGMLAPNRAAGTFYSSLGYVDQGELLFFKTGGGTPNRASTVMVYHFNTNSTFSPTPNSLPPAFISTSHTILHDFIIDTTKINGGPLTNYSLRLSVGEDYFDTQQLDNSGTSTYTIDAMVAVPEASSMLLIATITSVGGVVAWRRGRTRHSRYRLAGE